MRPLWSAAVLVTLVQCASALEATSSDDYDDETSLLQVVQRHISDETSLLQAPMATVENQTSLDTVVQSQSQQGAEIAGGRRRRKSQKRCRKRMKKAPRVIRRAMYRKRHVDVCAMKVRKLKQKHFAKGTYRISKPGIYKVMEDIVMAPDTGKKMLPPKDSEEYKLEDGYWLGFVAAIAVESDNVYLDLNGKSISMSEEFLMRQRFFSVIQLGSRPFEAKTGPPQFKKLETETFWASNVVITDGQLGMTSHTGIHGWNNSNIWIKNVEIADFETAGIQINGASDVFVDDTDIGPNLGHPYSSGKVPGLATLSQAQLLLRVIEGEGLEDPDEKFARLNTSVETYIEQTLAGGVIGEAEQIFENPAGLPDGSSLHGIVFHASKLAIHDFASCAEFNGGEEGNFFGPLKLRNVQVKDLQLKTDEVVSLQIPDPDNEGKMKPIMGPAGDVLQAFRFQDSAGNYVGNVLSEAQLALGKMKLDDEEEDKDKLFQKYGATNIPQEFLDWATGAKSWDEMVTEAQVGFVCMKDAMTHHNKGVMGVRIEYYHEVVMRNLRLANFENIGEASEVEHCDDDDAAYSGNDVRGLTMSHIAGLRVVDVTIRSMDSAHGSAWGVEERVSVDYGGFEYDIDGIRGHEGSTLHDRGVAGQLDSDVTA